MLEREGGDGERVVMERGRCWREEGDGEREGGDGERGR